MIQTKFDGLFGMYEMERAAERINNEMLETNRTCFAFDDFKTSDERIGFIELIHHGWMEKPKPPYNGVFKPGKKFLARIQGAR